MDRRALLSSLGALGVSGLAGCSTLRDDDLPAGSLRFENRDDLPHVVGISVVAVGTESETDSEGYSVTGEAHVPSHERELRASSSVGPGETQTFEDVFTGSVYYLVEFTLDGEVPETDARVPYNPSPPEREYYSVLEGVVSGSGELSWQVSSTDNAGRFRQ